MKQKEIQHGTLFNLFLSISFVVSGLIIFIWGLKAIGYYFSNGVEGNSFEESLFWIISGLLLFFTSCYFFFSKKIIVKNSVFGISFLTILFSVILYLLFYFNDIETSYFLFFFLIYSAFIFLLRKKHFKTLLKYTTTTCTILVTFVITLLFIHASFSTHPAEEVAKSAYETYINQMRECVETNKANSIKWGFIPVKHNCYLNRYLNDDEKLTVSKTLLFDIFYGKPDAYQKFHVNKIDYALINHDSEQAIYLFQIAYEALQKRHEISNNESYKNTVSKILKHNKEDYILSKNSTTEEFFNAKLLDLDIESMVNKIESNKMDPSNMLNMSHIMFFSLMEDGYSTQSLIEKRQEGGITLEDIKRYKDNVYNSGKSVLFSNYSEEKNNYVIVYDQYKSLGDLIDRLQ